MNSKVGVTLGAILLFGVVFDALMPNFYIFDQNNLQQIALSALAQKPNSTQGLIDIIVANLSSQYPGHINTQQEWIFNNAGGAMGAMYLIHTSISEYLIIFGTPVGTEGHTGRFLADDYFIILDGEQWAFSEGQLEREVYKPGHMHHLQRGTCQQYRMPDKCWALEYARGWIPLMLPFGVADTLTSTLDVVTLSRTVLAYAKGVTSELLQGKI
mmetsp:Transcript_29155/g.41033  ORF Transcript_29155/g.41033 Transcript_29155/m.41033 type:complete len:213 (+) Transcript_29155:28-666(+)